jgi:multisubunit Na+/H+ antiporter MnhB subunit
MDSRLAGGKGTNAGRRVGAIVAMLVGGYIGALFVLHIAAGWGLIVQGLILALGTLLLHVARRREVARA